MSTFFSELAYERIKLDHPELLRQMDQIIALPGGGSLAERPAAEADRVFMEFLESRFHQGTVPGNLGAFAESLRIEGIHLDSGMTPRQMIHELYRHRDAIWNRIDSME